MAFKDIYYILNEYYIRKKTRFLDKHFIALVAKATIVLLSLNLAFCAISYIHRPDC